MCLSDDVVTYVVRRCEESVETDDETENNASAAATSA